LSESRQFRGKLVFQVRWVAARRGAASRAPVVWARNFSAWRADGTRGLTYALVKLLYEMEDRHGALHKSSPAAADQAARPIAARLPGHQRRHRHACHQTGAHGRHWCAVGAERSPDPVREHRRETGLPALRYPGEKPPLAGARPRHLARELSAHARLPATPASARSEEH